MPPTSADVCEMWAGEVVARALDSLAYICGKGMETGQLGDLYTSSSSQWRPPSRWSTTSMQVMVTVSSPFDLHGCRSRAIGWNSCGVEFAHVSQPTIPNHMETCCRFHSSSQTLFPRHS